PAAEQELLGKQISSLEAEITGQNQAGFNRDAGLPEGVLVAFEPVLRGLEQEIAVDHADAAVADGDQVAHAHLRPVNRIGDDGMRTQMPRQAVEADYRNLRRQHIPDVTALAVARRDYQENPVNALRAHDRHYLLFPLHLVVRVGRDEQV